MPSWINGIKLNSALSVEEWHKEIEEALTPIAKDDSISSMPIESVNPGTIKSVDGKIQRKQFDGSWRIKGSTRDTFDIDLQERKESGTLNSMADNSTSLIPLADKYLDEGFNIMLIGPHGTGKTESLQQLAKARNLKMKYYSCSTLDPFTDLVGVPSPRIHCDEHGDFETRLEHRTMHPDCGASLSENLKMIRPRDIDEAEFIFFDEFNRADAKTLNAIFEIIQFRSINGEPLPNLKACWAAMNPPDGNYEVERLDPALLDRFDLYIEVHAKPSVTYMSKFMHEVTAKTLHSWWNEHDRSIRAGKKDAMVDYISPRRLMKIGLIWEATGNVRSVNQSFPAGDFDTNKLISGLKAAQRHILAEASDNPLAPVVTTKAGVGDGAAEQFFYDAPNLEVKQVELVDFLTKNPQAHETHKKVVNTLKQGIGGAELINRFAPTLNALNPALFEGMFTSFIAIKQKQMRETFEALVEKDRSEAESYPVLWKVLAAGAKPSYPRP